MQTNAPDLGRHGENLRGRSDMGRTLKTAQGSAVHIEEDARGIRWVVCAGCRKRSIVTGFGSPRSKAERHARTCRR
ncbi:hypothetical protein ACIBK8_12510 [Streptomyces sp. NPDC050161]|uniref:hypothetical protein n=1 Tax=Streptomyces sp. NPDC050161 TaxID=3365604 RepID=UPI0037ACAF6C